MSEIIMWSLLAFFGAFGLIEFIRFIFVDCTSTADDCHLVVCAKNKGPAIESSLRNAVICANSRPVFVIDDGSDEDVSAVVGKLAEKYIQIEVLTVDEYIDFLHSKEC